jgi:hypothetical protein
MPYLSETELRGTPHTFRFDCMNVFTNAGVDTPFPDAPRLSPGTRIRFFTVLSRPDRDGGDTLVLWRELPLTPAGAVHVDEAPADVPMFEQLVDARGNVLRTGNGVAQAVGFNFSRFGSGTRCVGCHAGHSVLSVPRNGTSAAYVNASPSADVTASSAAPGSAGPRAAVDRRTHGPAGQVGWVASSGAGEWLRLVWPWPMDVREIVLYALAADRASGTDLRLGACDLVFTLDGRPVRHVLVPAPIAAGGTRVPCDSIRADALEIRPRVAAGRVLGRPAAGLAEVETIARLAIP